MIQIGSFLSVVDNSGAKKVACIRINASCKKRYAYTGDNIIVSVKSLRSKRRIFSKVQKGEIFVALVIRTKKSSKDFFKNQFSFSQNAAVLLNRQNKLIGTRVFGALPKTFRFSKYMRMISLCSGVVK